LLRRIGQYRTAHCKRGLFHAHAAVAAAGPADGDHPIADKAVEMRSAFLHAWPDGEWWVCDNQFAARWIDRLARACMNRRSTTCANRVSPDWIVPLDDRRRKRHEPGDHATVTHPARTT
jgi:hypothetical protein